jgi:hypothetical protein
MTIPDAASDHTLLADLRWLTEGLLPTGCFHAAAGSFPIIVASYALSGEEKKARGSGLR